jgi:hypothetical protein
LNRPGTDPSKSNGKEEPESAAYAEKALKYYESHIVKMAWQSYCTSWGVDIRTAQAMHRHANSRIKLDIYPRCVSEDEPEDQYAVFRGLLNGSSTQHSSAPWRGHERRCHIHKPLIILVYGGDDGVRTHNLCRDSDKEARNLQKTSVTDAPFGAPRNDQERLSAFADRLGVPYRCGRV